MPIPTERFTGNYKDHLPELFARRFMSRTRKEKNGCWTWTGSKGKSGYGRINSGGKIVRAHRVAHELFIGPIPPGLEVLHSCDNKACVNPEHLEAALHKKNMRDASARGCVAKRSLTQEQAASILKDPDRKSRSFVSRKAKEFGVQPRAVRRALLGETWAFLHRPEV